MSYELLFAFQLPSSLASKLISLEPRLEYRNWDQNANLLNRPEFIGVQPCRSGIYVFLVL